MTKIFSETNCVKQSFTYQKNLSEYGEYDVAVIGGGPSGVCAAVEAARNGAKVVLIESSGMLGGMATSALVGPFMTCYDRTGTRPVVGGLFSEIVERLKKCEGALDPSKLDAPGIYTSFIGPYHKHVTPVDPFLLQIVLDDLVAESGVDVLLYTHFADCVVEENRISRLILLKLQGLCSLTAKIVIDCTGNASVAATAGVPTWKGDDITHVPQPGTLMFEVDGVEDSRYTERPQGPVKAYRMPEVGRYKVNHYHVYDIDATNSESMTEAHREARKQVIDAYRILHEKTPGFENARLTQVASVLGIRESRHVQGKYLLKAEDLREGKRFEDRIAAYAFGMDVHSRTPAEKGNFKIPTADVYYIPYRSLVPLNADNLLIAGKTISCESQAAGAIRVMPCAMAIGQAAGVAAWISVKDRCSPSDITVTELQNVLIKHGAILD